MAGKLYDVVVIGSGAGGGTLSARLAHLGADVLVLEGGPKVDTRTDFNTHALPFQFPPRSIPIMKPGKPGFDGERSRGLGGKTQLWNAVALRLSQRDFKGRQHDGAGQDWPFGYSEMAPLLRSHRTGSRRVRQLRSSRGFAGRHLPAARADEVYRSRSIQDGARQARRPGDSRPQSDPQPPQGFASGLPFLRQLHVGLRCRRQVQFARRAHGSGAQDGQAYAAIEQHRL